jgi:hypothetical protein
MSIAWKFRENVFHGMEFFARRFSIAWNLRNMFAERPKARCSMITLYTVWISPIRAARIHSARESILRP